MRISYEESRDERGEIMLIGWTDNRLAKITENGKPDTRTASKTLARKLDVNQHGRRIGTLDKI